MTGAVAGMRGGLGRILLTAFLLLAIVPLSAVNYLAIKRVQRDVRQAAIDDLEHMTASTEARLLFWLDAHQSRLVSLTSDLAFEQAVRDGAWADACRVLSDVRSGCGESMAVSLLSSDKEETFCSLGVPRSGLTMSSEGSLVLSVTTVVADEDEHVQAVVVGYPDPQILDQVVDVMGLEADGRLLLVNESAELMLLLASERELWPEGPLHSWAIDAAVAGEQGSGFYDDVFGIPVVGAYRWLPDLQAALLLERPQETALAREDDLAAVLIGSTLAVALLTTMLAAVIIRRLTRPIVQLTMSAVKIANGDLSQRVEVRRRDEIGILARAFNIMTAELSSLYDGLEQKVAQRTHQLTEANRQLRYQAMQLTLSAEVGRVATSILDLDVLLDRVTKLILDSYARVYYVYYVAILLQDEFGEWLELQASNGIGGRPAGSRVAVRDNGSVDDPIGQAVVNGVLRAQELEGDAVEIAVPLRIGTRVIGILDLYCARQDVLVGGDLEVLQSLGDQISVAIENARAYAAEREAVERLSRLDDMRLASLGAGSRELATELNTIIGFSRLLLKGVDGPLTDIQRTDLAAIHKSGYSLLGLIDNVITLSELESGTRELGRQSVDLIGMLDEVVATARQRFVEVAIGWNRPEERQESGDLPGRDLPGRDLPLIQGDVGLLRQAFLCLVTAAAEQVPRSQVTVRTSVMEGDPCRVAIYIGVPRKWAGDEEMWEAMMRDAMTRDLDTEADRGVGEMSVGLALARQIIALHRGWVQFEFDAEQGLNSLAVLVTPLPTRRGEAAVGQK